MKTTHSNIASADAQASAAARYQIYQQTRAGVFTPGFKSNSASEAVEAFLKQAPMIEGGEIRLWNHRTQEVRASVEWHREKTDFGFPVLRRTNHFHDRLLGVLARQLQEREEIREEIQHSVRMSA